MTKKPVNAGPADVVIALDAVARKIAKLLDDNGMRLGRLGVEHGCRNVVYFDQPNVPRSGDGLTSVTIPDEMNVSEVVVVR